MGTPEMQLLSVLVMLAAAVTPGYQSSMDMSCDCRLWHLRHFSFNLHCTGEQSGTPMVNCQRSQEPDIPQGYHYISGYALVKQYRTMKTWAAAKKACEEEGALLAVPRDKDAYAGLIQIMKLSGVGWANLGISDQLSEGLFVGVDGRPVSYLPWNPNEPNNYGNIEDCVDVNSKGMLNDAACTNTAPYFCERRLSVAIPEAYRWVADAGRFYRVHPEKHVHAEAARVCRSENAGLAVPDTRRRGEALLTQFNVGPNSNQLYYVGFTDEATEGDFITETGRHLRDMEFQVWEDGQPNNNDNGKPENCVALSERGYYNDARCDLELPFVCEILPV